MVDMYCFQMELTQVERGDRDALTLYREPGIGHGKVIKVRVAQPPKGRSLV